MKKIIIFLLACVLTGGIFCSCSKDDNEVTEEEFLNSLKDFKHEKEIISNGLFDTLIKYLNDFTQRNSPRYQE